MPIISYAYYIRKNLFCVPSMWRSGYKSRIIVGVVRALMIECMRLTPFRSERMGYTPFCSEWPAPTTHMYNGQHVVLKGKEQHPSVRFTIHNSQFHWHCLLYVHSTWRTHTDRWTCTWREKKSRKTLHYVRKKTLHNPHNPPGQYH